MSVNIGQEAVAAHAEILSGSSNLSWAVFSLPANNELKVQETGSGETLDDLTEEFSDGRFVPCQFARLRMLITVLE